MKEIILSLVLLTLFVIDFGFTSNRNELWYICPTDTGTCEDTECTLAEGAQRAGYTCNQFPFYSGGFAPAEWSDEVNCVFVHIKYYICIYCNYN